MSIENWKELCEKLSCENINLKYTLKIKTDTITNLSKDLRNLCDNKAVIPTCFIIKILDQIKE